MTITSRVRSGEKRGGSDLFFFSPDPARRPPAFTVSNRQSVAQVNVFLQVVWTYAPEKTIKVKNMCRLYWHLNKWGHCGCMILWKLVSTTALVLQDKHQIVGFHTVRLTVADILPPLYSDAVKENKTRLIAGYCQIGSITSRCLGKGARNERAAEIEPNCQSNPSLPWYTTYLWNSKTTHNI